MTPFRLMARDKVAYGEEMSRDRRHAHQGRTMASKILRPCLDDKSGTTGLSRVTQVYVEEDEVQEIGDKEDTSKVMLHVPRG